MTKLVASLLVLASAGGAIAVLASDDSHPKSSPGQKTRTISTESGGLPPFLTSDPKLAGYSDAIFVGTVVSKIPSPKPAKSSDRLPETFFKVDVGQTLKGATRGFVTVAQFGGYSAEEGAVILIEGEPLMEPGAEYLFVAKNDRETPGSGVLYVVEQYGLHKVGSAEDRDRLVARFTTAVQNEQDPYAE